MNILDIHTHHQENPQSILNCEPSHFFPQPGKLYSLGIHPWNITANNDKEIELLKELSNHPQVVAIGETGIDKTIHIELSTQQQLFETHIQLAEQLGKPLLIHSVKSSNEIIRLKKNYQPESPWIIHGFRGKKELAEQLIRHHIYLSYGERYNNDSLLCTPIQQLFIETDESTKPIFQLYQEIAQKRSLTIEMLTTQVQQNILALFFRQ